jgi:hypothetical protein
MTLYTFDPKSKSKSNYVELLRIIYIGLLYREPDPYGFNRYLDLLEDGTLNEEQLISNIKRSDEYRLKHTNSNLINIAFLELLNSEPLDSEFNRYLDLLEDGTLNEEQLISNIKRSDEYKLLAKNSEIVRKCYLEILYREPDPSGFNAFLDHLKNGDIDEEQLISKLKKSDEYKISQAYFEIFGIKITEFDSDFFQNKLKSIVPLNYDKIKEKMKNTDLYEKFLYRNKFSQKYSTGKIYRYVD